MNAIDIAKQLYKRHGLNLAEDIGRHLDCGGVVHCEPELFLIARPMDLRTPARWPEPGQADAWYVTLAIGRRSFGLFLQLMPYFLPKLAWHRMFRGDARLHVHDTNRFIKFNRR